MKEIWALSLLLIMAAFTLPGGLSIHFPSVHMKPNNGLTLVCPRYHLVPATETYCLVNITHMKESNCVHPDGMIHVYDVADQLLGVIGRQPHGEHTNCLIHANSGQCVSSPSCTDCHSSDGLETRVYLTESKYDDRIVMCFAECPPNAQGRDITMASYPCLMYSRRVAVVGHNEERGIQNHSLQVRTICPRRADGHLATVYSFPFNIPCRINITSLRQGPCNWYQPFDVYELILTQSNWEGAFFKPRVCKVTPHWKDKCAGQKDCNCTRVSDDVVEVTFLYRAKDARLGFIITSCEVKCRNTFLQKDVQHVSDTSCSITLTNPAYSEDPIRVGGREMTMWCPPYIPKLPFYLKCKVDTKYVHHKHPKCFTDNGTLIVREVRTWKSDNQDGSGYTARPLAPTPTECHVQGVECVMTDRCRYCHWKDDVLEVGFLYSEQPDIPWLQHESWCEIECNRTVIRSKDLCVVYFNPGKAFDDRYQTADHLGL